MATQKQNRRETWQHREILILADAYRSGGPEGAYKAFPDRDRAGIDRKLEELEMGPTISETQQKLIAHFVRAVAEGANPKATARAAMRELRKIG